MSGTLHCFNIFVMYFMLQSEFELEAVRCGQQVSGQGLIFVGGKDLTQSILKYNQLILTSIQSDLRLRLNQNFVFYIDQLPIFLYFIKFILLNLLMTDLTHNYSTPDYAAQQWKGLKPQRFKGGRKHDNHPQDELDFLLLGASSLQEKYLGPSKKRFEQKMTIGTDEFPKPHIRVFQEHNQSKVVFSAQQIPKLIKIPPSGQYKESNSILFRNNQIGESKLKNLQTGTLKNGIYRNFYKSQFKAHSTQLY